MVLGNMRKVYDYLSKSRWKKLHVIYVYLHVFTWTTCIMYHPFFNELSLLYVFLLHFYLFILMLLVKCWCEERFKIKCLDLTIHFFFFTLLSCVHFLVLNRHVKKICYDILRQVQVNKSRHAWRMHYMVHGYFTYLNLTISRDKTCTVRLLEEH